MGFEGSGLAEAMQRLRTLEANADKILQKALIEGAMMIQGTAKLLCPVDTGQLRNSIVVAPLPRGAVIGTNLEYAAHVEYGTGPAGATAGGQKTYKSKGWRFKDHVTGKWVHSNGQAPQPFLYPAVVMSEERVKKHIASKISEALKGR